MTTLAQTDKVDRPLVLVRFSDRTLRQQVKIAAAEEFMTVQGMCTKLLQDALAERERSKRRNRKPAA